MDWTGPDRTVSEQTMVWTSWRWRVRPGCDQITDSSQSRGAAINDPGGLEAAGPSRMAILSDEGNRPAMVGWSKAAQVGRLGKMAPFPALPAPAVTSTFFPRNDELLRRCGKTRVDRGLHGLQSDRLSSVGDGLDQRVARPKIAALFTC